MFWKKKEKDLIPPLEEREANPNWFVDMLFNDNFHYEGNWGYMDVQEWEGFANYSEVLPYMEKKGWMYISHSSVVYEGHGTCVEIVFRKIDVK